MPVLKGGKLRLKVEVSEADEYGPENKMQTCGIPIVTGILKWIACEGLGERESDGEKEEKRRRKRGRKKTSSSQDGTESHPTVVDRHADSRSAT